MAAHKRPIISPRSRLTTALANLGLEGIGIDRPVHLDRAPTAQAAGDHRAVPDLTHPHMIATGATLHAVETRATGTRQLLVELDLALEPDDPARWCRVDQGHLLAPLVSARR